MNHTDASRLLYSWPRQTPPKDQEAVANDPEPMPKIEGVSRLWYWLATGLIGACVVLLLALGGTLKCSNVAVLSSFRLPRPDGQQCARPGMFSRGSAVMPRDVIGLLAWPLLVLYNGPGWQTSAVASLLGAAAMGLPLASVYDVIRSLRTSSAGYKRSNWLMLVITITLFLFWLKRWRDTFYNGKHHEGFFAAYRSLDLINGLAPTIPFSLISLAIICWAWIHPRRLRIFGEAPRTAPPLGKRFLGPTRAGELVTQMNRLNDDAQDPFLLPLAAYAAAGLIFAFLYFVMREYTQSLELRSFDELYGMAFAVIVLLLLTCARMVSVWIKLRRLLHTIEQHAIRETFGSVALEDHWGPLLYGGIGRDQSERRWSELLRKCGDARGAAVSDAELEAARNEELDPAWEGQHPWDEGLKAATELLALRYVEFI